MPPRPSSGADQPIVIADTTSLESFKNDVRMWMELDNSIRRLQAAIKERREAKKIINARILDFMSKYKIDDLNTREGYAASGTPPSPPWPPATGIWEGRGGTRAPVRQEASLGRVCLGQKSQERQADHGCGGGWRCPCPDPPHHGASRGPRPPTGPISRGGRPSSCGPGFSSRGRRPSSRRPGRSRPAGGSPASSWPRPPPAPPGSPHGGGTHVHEGYPQVVPGQP